jgi:dienelactone hydrolase
VVAGTNRFPIIIHSHGFYCDRTLNSGISVELASHGYIVAAVDHLDSHATVYPNGRSRYTDPNTVEGNSALGKSRTNDLEYLATALAQFDSTDAILRGRLDTNIIGAMGFSWGGGTAGEVCRNDSRIKCAALLDPAIFTENSPAVEAGGLQKPFLTMTETVAMHTNITPSPNDFWGWSSNLFRLATTNATWFEVANAGHTTFTDLGLMMDSGAGPRKAALAVNGAVLWFFDTFLLGKTTSFPTNAEIKNLQQK